jgi:hypothetical protein
MKFRYLMLLIALPSCAGDSDCTTTEFRTLHATEPADPPLQLKIDSCRVDVDACPALCGTAMNREGINQSVTKCDVTFVDDVVTMKVQFEVWHDGPNCAVAVPASAGGDL